MSESISIPFYQRMLDKSDATGRAQFSRELEGILINSRPGGSLRPRFYWGIIRRYRAKDSWRKYLNSWCGNIFVDGWQAAERYHGIETQGRR